MALATLVILLSVSAFGESVEKINSTTYRKQLEMGNIESPISITKSPNGQATLRGKFKTYYDPAKDDIKDDSTNNVNDAPQTEDGKKEGQKFEAILDYTSDSAKELRELHKAHGVQENIEAPENTAFWTTMFSLSLTVGLILFLFYMFRRAQNQMMGGGGGGFLSSFNQSPAKQHDPSDKQTTFKDVAGLEGVKADLTEIVDFLKEPERFQKLGARVPKGVLLNGPPGTGKTLLARAVAGEAEVPFYNINGSEFIQMFVGVGASRVRDLFRTAKESSPAIIFIDEIDAVGRQRGAGLGGGHDEREQTLNQILSEMDGFSPKETVIVMAATNRPDVLDPALLRPGRFDRHITVDRPTQKARKAIFGVHVKKVPLADDVDLDRLAAITMGLTGADIQNLVNEAALWATRQKKTEVEMCDFEHAHDKVLMGSKREEEIQQHDKRKTAYHEAGHALVAWLLPESDRVHKVTIIPRGRALGVTQLIPDEDATSISQEELLSRLAMIMGGRVAEQIVYNENGAGVENDLERATSIARKMVTKWGMSQRLGPVSYNLSDEDPFLGKEMHQSRMFSEHTMQLIDEEIATLLEQATAKAKRLLETNREKLETLTNALLEKEEISEEEIAEMIGPAARTEKKTTDEHTEEPSSNSKPVAEEKSEP